MVLTYQEVEGHVIHTLGGEPDPSLPMYHVINGAGRYFMSHHPWQFMVGRSVRLNWKAPISFSSAQFTQTGLVLQSTGTFTDYNHHEGDQVEITGGATSAVGQTIEIESRTDDDNIVLKSNPSSQIDPDGAPATSGSAHTITFTDGTWTEATKTISAMTPATLTGFVWRSGMKVQITDGTGATAGEYELASTSTDTALVLTTSIGALADGEMDIDGYTNGDIDGTINFNYVELPTDFGEMVTIDATDSLVREFYPTSLHHVQELRSNPIEVTTWYHWGAFSSVRKDDGTVVPILELWPTPDSDEFGVLTIFYRAKWNDIGDGGFVKIPEFAYEYYLAIVRAFARGYEEEDTASLDERLRALYGGELARACRRFDGARQGNYALGPILNGAIQMVSEPEQTPFARSPVAHPS